MKKLSPNQLRAVLQGLVQNLSYREIERRCDVAKSTIGYIRNVCIQTQQSIGQLLKLNDNELISLVYPTSRNKQSEPDWQEIYSHVGRRGITLLMLFEQYKKQYPGCTYSYASFCRRYTQWKTENGIRHVDGNVERIPGERMEIDFAGDKIEWVDRDGVIRQSKLFVASLPYSCMLFTEAFEDESQNSWIDGIVDALEYFGAAPQVLVMDNAKALVKLPGWHEAEAQSAIRSLCSYYGMQPWACKPRTPKQKNRVEAAVNDVERWVIAQMSLDQPILVRDLEDLNQKIRQRVNEINDAPFKGRGTTGNRRLRYQKEELPHMNPLPAMPYEYGVWKYLVVDKAHCIRLASDGGHRYSTPASYIGKKVAVRVCRAKVEIYDIDTMTCLGIHERFTELGGNKTHILKEHLTSAEKHYRRSTREWIELFIGKGIPSRLAEEVVTYLKEGKGHFPSGRTCGALYGLFKNYSSNIVAKALSAALEDRVVNYKHVRMLCDHFDFVLRSNGVLDLAASEERKSNPIIHQNIRNNYE